MRERDVASGPPRPRGVLDWWLRDRSTGRIAVLQWPNPALCVWATATVIGWLGIFSRAEEIRWIGAGALIAWGVDELIRGVSPARRILGLIVFGWQIYRLAS